MAQKEQFKTITHTNPTLFLQEVQDLCHQGWDVDFVDNPPMVLFDAWTVGMFFNERRAHDIAERILNKRPKMTDRAEIMALARSKKGKNKEKEGEE